MRFSSFCFRMANKIILREIKKTCQPFQCDVYLSDWTLKRSLVWLNLISSSLVVRQKYHSNASDW